MEESGPPVKARKLSANSTPRSTSTAVNTFNNTTYSTTPKASAMLPPNTILPPAEPTPNEVDIEEQEELFQIVLEASRKSFTNHTFGRLRFPDSVRKLLGADRDDKIIHYLTRPPQQVSRRDHGNFNWEGNGKTVEYDALHFYLPTSKLTPDGYDEIHHRKTIHHDIAFAIHKLNIIESKLRRDGYKTWLSVPDAHLVLLLFYLIKADEEPGGQASYQVRHRISDAVPVREEADENGKDYDTYIPPMPMEARPIKYYEYLKPYYIRTVTDLNVIKALEGLRLKCFQFLVKDDDDDDKGRQYAAYAFLREKVVMTGGREGEEKLGVDVEMRYFALPSDEMPEKNS